MSGDSSLLVEKLWRLKRRIDKGACPGVEFVHLNTLLREPNYRADVLRRVESAGTPELKALAREIREVDSGEPLMAREVTSRLILQVLVRLMSNKHRVHSCLVLDDSSSIEILNPSNQDTPAARRRAG